MVNSYDGNCFWMLDELVFSLCFYACLLMVHYAVGYVGVL